MNLDRQLQQITTDASKYGISEIVIEKAIAPTLKILAEKIGGLQYYILQNLTGDWVTFEVKIESDKTTKRTIYAFTNLEDAAKLQGKEDPEILAVPINIIDLLFRLFSVEQVENVVFFNKQPDSAIAISRKDLQKLIKQQLQQLVNTPPDIA